MRPLERLPTKRTGSIGSRVPPALISTRIPSQGRLPPGSSASTWASSAAGSGRRPRPNSPRDAWVDQPHSMPASAPTVSSESPNTLPTSRIALRAR